MIEKVILKAEKDGYKTMADFHRLYLAEVYLQIMTGGDKKVPLPILLRNLPILFKVMFTAGSRIRALITHVLDNPHFDPAGFHVGRAKMILGLLYKVKKKRALAVQHLTEAKRSSRNSGKLRSLRGSIRLLRNWSNSYKRFLRLRLEGRNP